MILKVSGLAVGFLRISQNQMGNKRKYQQNPDAFFVLAVALFWLLLVFLGAIL
jgi:hypothetical protein